MLVDIGFQLGVGPAVARLRALRVVLDQLVGPEARLARAAVHQRIVEAAHVAARHPDLAVHQDRRVQTHVVFVLLHKLLPPGALDVVLELHAQRAVIPAVGQAAVDLAARIDEAAPLAQGHQLVHGQSRHREYLPSLHWLEPIGIFLMIAAGGGFVKTRRPPAAQRRFRSPGRSGRGTRTRRATGPAAKIRAATSPPRTWTGGRTPSPPAACRRAP